MVTTEQALKIYRQEILNLDDSEDLPSDALLVLSTRGFFTDIFLTDAEQETLTTLDDELVRRQELLAEVLPFPSQHPRSEWWWYLHEGQQVRRG